MTLRECPLCVDIDPRAAPRMGKYIQPGKDTNSSCTREADAGGGQKSPVIDMGFEGKEPNVAS